MSILTPLSENHLKLDDIGWFFSCALISNGTDIVKGCSTIIKKFSVIPVENKTLCYTKCKDQMCPYQMCAYIQDVVSI